MKKNIRGLLALGLVAGTLLTGCQIGDTNIVISRPLSSRYVFQIGEMSCSVKEAKLYLANYQNLYGTAYTLNLWEHDFGDESLEEYIKAITMNELVTMVCMNQLATEKEISLNEADESKIKEAAKVYYESLSDEERSYLGVSEADIVTYYEHYGLAQKVLKELTGEINGEVSDDEARVMEVLQIYVTDAEKAAEVSEKLRNGEDFASVANMYNELPSIQSNICRDDLPDEVEAVVFQMDDNEISNGIEAEGGYYFIKCLNKYNVELTEANKVTIVEKREKEAFDDVYNEFVAGLDSRINEDVWEELKLDTTSQIKTGSFIETYE